MKELGKVQPLEVLRFTSVGAYLNALDETSDTDVLLPTKYVPDEIQVGDMLDVFLYKDSEDRLIATTLKPHLALGEIGCLKVVGDSEYGAFLDWGLEKDLFLPFKEQKSELIVGQSVLVIVYIDCSGRLCASMKIDKYLSASSPYKEGDRVKGTIYQIHPTIGAFVAVDDQYLGLIPKRECIGTLNVGESISIRIARIQHDGKLDLAIRDVIANQIHHDVDVIKQVLLDCGGQLPYNDKTDPDIIRQKFNMSKKAFKRALGVLLKNGEISFLNDGIVHRDFK